MNDNELNQFKKATSHLNVVMMERWYRNFPDIEPGSLGPHWWAGSTSANVHFDSMVLAGIEHFAPGRCQMALGDDRMNRVSALLAAMNVFGLSIASVVEAVRRPGCIGFEAALESFRLSREDFHEIVEEFEAFMVTATFDGTKRHKAMMVRVRTLETQAAMRAM